MPNLPEPEVQETKQINEEINKYIDKNEILNCIKKGPQDVSSIQVPQESQNANFNVIDHDADNHSPPQPNDQIMNLVQSLTNSVTSLQQQVSEMA
jgi:hypothetical protein